MVVTCSASVNVDRFDALLGARSDCIACRLASWPGLDRVIIASANQQRRQAAAPGRNLLSTSTISFVPKVLSCGVTWIGMDG